MIISKKKGNMKKQTFLQTLLSISLLASITPVNAIEIDNNGLTGSFDTTVSWGAQRRVQDRDPALIARWNPAFPPLFFSNVTGTGYTSNNDEGNKNYDKGLISHVVKVTHDLDVDYKNFGAFVRGTYFYDFVNNDKDSLSNDAKDRVGKDADILDAYIRGSFDIGGKALDLRLGNQVVSWGESTFIQNSINSLNPVNVSKIRVPGAELREALLPVPMIFASQEINENVSIEAVYQFRFKHTEIDPVGTYFSTNDFAGDGGQYAIIGFGAVPEGACGSTNPALAALAANCIPRSTTDKDADDDGQFGLALRWFVPELNDTEFGFYGMRYHSRLPIISAIAATTFLPNPPPSPPSPVPSSGLVVVEYPEDIDLLGISFNTEIPKWGIALQGEYSHRLDTPLQIDDVELLLSALCSPNSQIGACPNGPGGSIDGYRRLDVGQFQMTATKIIGADNPFGASQWVLLGEVGVTHVYDMPDKNTLRFEGPGASTPGNPLVAAGFGVPAQTDGFADATSWGYRFVTRLDYNDVGNGINLSPRLAFAYDVNGTSPGPGGNFLEGRKAITLGLGATYLNQWSADMSYTTFFGAKGFNQIHDRDFIAANVKYSF